MTTIDPAQERRRLQEYYATQPDEALLQLAADPASLTELAAEVLASEMARRNLVTESALQELERTAEGLQTSFSDDSPPLESDEDLVIVREFRDVHAALLAKGALDSAGIPNAMLNSNMVRMSWFISNLLGGVKLQVRAEDAQTATDILDQAIPEGFDVDGVGEYQQPRCPNCGSVDITFEAINKGIAYGSAYLLGVPIPFPRNVWKCESCGQQWRKKEEGSDGQES